MISGVIRIQGLLTSSISWRLLPDVAPLLWRGAISDEAQPLMTLLAKVKHLAAKSIWRKTTMHQSDYNLLFLAIFSARTNLGELVVDVLSLLQRHYAGSSGGSSGRSSNHSSSTQRWGGVVILSVRTPWTHPGADTVHTGGAIRRADAAPANKTVDVKQEERKEHQEQEEASRTNLMSF